MSVKEKTITSLLPPIMVAPKQAAKKKAAKKAVKKKPKKKKKKEVAYPHYRDVSEFVGMAQRVDLASLRMRFRVIPYKGNVTKIKKHGTAALITTGEDDYYSRYYDPSIVIYADKYDSYDSKDPCTQTGCGTCPQWAILTKD
jgi:hypothetical protein